MSMKRLTLFLLGLVMSIGWAVAQNRTVTGTVISSEDNEPVIGASVVVVGQTSIGAATGTDGKFKLSVPANAKQLQVSCVGMRTEVVAITPTMNIVLHPDNDMLETVVVLGYGSGQKLSTVSGSVARVSSEKLENKPINNVMDGLQGQVAGMQVTTGSGDPTSSSSVQIHGPGSLGTSSAPLYIVDGVQTSQYIVNAMNANDIESFTVLKDASSTSIYGSRAANGVIVITTKRGKKNQDGRIALNAMYGISTINNKRPLRNMMTGQELIEYQMRHQEKPTEFLKGFDTGSFAAERDQDGNLVMGAIVNGVFTPGATSKWINAEGTEITYQVPHILRDYDWMDYFFGRMAPTYQADLSITGGSDNISYYVSGGYFSQEAITASESFYNKFNLRSNIDARVKDWLRIGVNISGGVSKTRASSGHNNNNVDAGVFGALTIPKYFSPFVKKLDANGKPTQEDTKEYAEAILFHPSYPALSTHGGYFYSPYYDNKMAFRSFTDYRINTSGFFELTPIEALILKSQAGVDMLVENNVGRNNPLWKKLSGYGSASRGFSTNYVFTWTNTAEYKWKMNDNNSFTFLLGQEFVDSRNEGFSASSGGMENPQFTMLQHGQKGDFLTLPTESLSEYAFFSVFGRVNYSFKDFLAFDFSLRNDRSSRFGRNHQAATFFSVGGMYDILKAHMPDNQTFSTLRFKLNYGTQGNSAIPLYAADALTGTITYTEKVAFGVTTIGNPNLTWERQGMLSTGVDLGFLDNRLTTEIAYYNRLTTGMLMAVPLPFFTGYGSRLENVGSMRNQGIDLTINYNFLDLKDWTANFGATFNYNDERVLALHTPQANEEGWTNGWGHYAVGHPLMLRYPQFAGIDPSTGKQLWYIVDKKGNIQYDADGNPRLTDTASPDIYAPLKGKRANSPISGGFQFDVTWRKQLTLSADFSFQAGGWFVNNDKAMIHSNAGRDFVYLNRSKDLLNEWTKGNTSTNIPKFGEEPVWDDRVIESNAFLRMKNLQLAWQMPKSFFKGQNIISGARIYVSARNLLTFTHKSFTHFDPEVSYGLAVSNFPNTRQFVTGVQLSF